ncbi:MAG: 3-ketoacyl-CoA thiolase [Chlamydiae bacterium]|nr:3-ketoacyl-CoA thiolase [Chlamydiota bacterium]
MKERIAVIDGIRTPFCKAGGVFRDWQADDLGAFVIKELMARIDISPEEIDEVIFGNVLQPPHASNVTRVLAVKGGLPDKVPAFTVNRNCASGLESIATASNKILVGDADIIIAGGTESMSNFPVLFRKQMREFLRHFSKAKTWKQKLKLLFSFRFFYLIPDIPGIADPLCGLSMGQVAELLSREFNITREEQDEYALMSQQRSAKAQDEGILAEEIVPIPGKPSFGMQINDDGVRHDSSMEALARLKPVFDRVTGTVTAGNSSQVTDGAAAVLLMKESKAKELGLAPLGYIRDYSYAALGPSRMGIGPVFAVSKLFAKTGMQLSDIDLIEVNEAFASQMISVERAFASDEFSKRELGRDKALGEIGRERLNVNGGAISLGHPIGVSGTRLVLTLLKELNRRNKNVGIATLCIGGGQGEAAVVEVA